MKVVIAVDSFKGSLCSLEAGNAVAEGIKRVNENIETEVCPLADGGEGTVEALTWGMGGEMQTITAVNPLGENIKCQYGIVGKTAIIEIASTAGLTLLTEQKRNPLYTTTYGVGEMIRDAVNRGCRKFIIGIGGSATNDGGTGMLEALGYEFLDEKDRPVGLGAKVLKNIVRVRTDRVMPELKECRFQIVCDVTNPLCGTNGATWIYGPQKGVTESLRDELDQALGSFAEVTKECTGTDFAQAEGAGAAGGLGFAFLSYLKGELKPGIELVLEVIKMEEAMEGADLVFTGEGRLDEQTAMGKAPTAIGKLAKKHGAKVVALAGCIDDGAEKCNEEGIDAYFPILRRILTLDEAMKSEVAAENMEKTAEQVFRLAVAMR